MPQFSNGPPDDSRGQALPLRRCPPNRPLTAVITCDDLVGCPTHFFGGRTVPCEVENCKPCLEGISWRWHGYVSAYLIKAKLHFLFEMTARCAEVLIQYRQAHGSLRGCLFEATRPSGNANGRVYMQTKPIDLEGIPVPRPPDLPKLLSMIWNLPARDAEINGRVKDHPRMQVHSTGNGQQHELQTANHEA